MPLRSLTRVRAVPLLWLLWLAALVLALWDLGNVPLRDWDEAIVARVSLELSRLRWPQLLLPTYDGEPYLNKPPGLHLGIAALIRLWQALRPAQAGALPPEWLVRLLPAVASSLLVPLLGLVQLRLRPSRAGAAVATAAITLTLLPLARHGRLAMLDGSQLSAMALVWLGLLSTTNRPRSAFGGGLLAGLGVSALLLLKAPVALPVLAGAMALRLADRELRRRPWFLTLIGTVVGSGAGLAWHGWHGLMRGDMALVMWGAQGMARLTSTLESHGGGATVPLIQFVVGGWPWLPLWPFGLVLAWRERATPAGRWSLGLSLLSVVMVFPLRTQLPWYSLLLWPPFALVCGPVLAALASGQAAPRVGLTCGRIWAALGALLLLAAAAVAVLPPLRTLLPEPLLPVPAAVGLLAAGTPLLGRWPSGRVRSGLLVLAVGWFLSLLLLFSTPLWNWELNEQPAVRPAQQLLPRPGEGGEPLPLRRTRRDPDNRRPSFLWYLDPSPPADERTTGPYGVLSRADRLRDEDERRRCRPVDGGPGGWRLWRCGNGGRANGGGT